MQDPEGESVASNKLDSGEEDNNVIDGVAEVLTTLNDVLSVIAKKLSHLTNGRKFYTQKPLPKAGSRVGQSSAHSLVMPVVVTPSRVRFCALNVGSLETLKRTRCAQRTKEIVNRNQLPEQNRLHQPPGLAQHIRCALP